MWLTKDFSAATCPTLLTFLEALCLAQAQECILEKSRTDNRKPTIIGRKMDLYFWVVLYFIWNVIWQGAMIVKYVYLEVSLLIPLPFSQSGYAGCGLFEVCPDNPRIWEVRFSHQRHSAIKATQGRIDWWVIQWKLIYFWALKPVRVRLIWPLIMSFFFFSF